MATLAVRVVTSFAFLLLLAAPAGAITFNPGPDFLADDGSEVFDPVFSVANGCNCVLLQEILDPIDGSGLAHEWGIYFQSDPGTLITVFDLADNAGMQEAVIDFDNGIVFDEDAGVLQTAFTPSADPFGFYLFVDNPNPTPDLLLFTEPSLNPGSVDVAGTFPTVLNPLIYLIAFEVSGQVLAIEAADALNPVPEPGSLALLALGGVVLLARRRGAAGR